VDQSEQNVARAPNVAPFFCAKCGVNALSPRRVLECRSMDFDQLNTFVEVAKHGSFSLAGRKVFRSQSAVSAQIRQLEQEYGQQLFGRLGKAVRFTPAGEVLLEFANKFLALRQD